MNGRNSPNATGKRMLHFANPLFLVLILATIPCSASKGTDDWEERNETGWGWSLQPFIVDSWPFSGGQFGFRILETPQSAKGMLDIRHRYDGSSGSPNQTSSVLNVKGLTDTGNNAAISGIRTHLVHQGDSDISEGFSIGVTSVINAEDLSPAAGTSAAIESFFGNTITPAESGWNAAAAELNVTNRYMDLGERLRINDYEPGALGSNISRILLLKPESSVGSLGGVGYSLDYYMVAGPDNHDDNLVGAYGGLIFRNDAIAADGTGIRLGGRTSAFPDGVPRTAIRIDHGWQRGIYMGDADLVGPAMGLSAQQRILWTTSAGNVQIWANDQGQLKARTPSSGTVTLVP